MAITLVICCFVHLDLLTHIDTVPVKVKNGRFGQNRCWFEGSRYIYYTYHFRWVLLVFMSLLPFACLMLGNCMIIYRMVKYNRERKRMSQGNCSNGTADKDSQSMTAMLISISLLFFITQTPAVVTSILRNNLVNQQRSAEYLMKFNVIDSVCRLLRWLNNVLNFFCYCISGTRFRQQLVLMLKSIRPSENESSKSQVTVSTINM